MIRLFDRNETNFNHNKTILTPLSCYVIEEANGMFELEAEFPKTTVLNDGDIIKAPTPRGEQLFRIYRSVKSLTSKKAYARHIFYDLSKNFLIDVNLDNVTGFTALQTVLDNADTDHNFIGISNVMNQNTARYTRINPIQAIIGEDNSILNLWSGNLIRDNFRIDIKANGVDRGYEIRLGKNLLGIDADIDESGVKTRIYPTVALGDDDTVYSLPEKYIDSPYMNNYGEPIIYTKEIKLTDEQKNLSIEEIYDIMREYCIKLFEVDNIDKPVINYKVNFVELSKTEQYKDLAILEQLDLYDILTVKISYLDIDVKARVIKYKYDCIKERYENIELGDFSAVSKYQTDSIVKQLRSSIKASQSAVDYATNVITGNKGGYIITRRYPDGKPYEFLVMDTEDINTAQNVFRLNKSGLGFSRNGYNGTFGTAMTIDGHIVADYMDTGTLTSVLLKSTNYMADTSGMRISLTDGTIDSKNFKVDSYGNITANNVRLNSGIFNGTLGANAINSDIINALNIIASSVKSDWVYAGNIKANQMTFGGASGNISYNSLTDTPTIPPPYTDAQSLQAWKDSGYSTFIDSTGVYTGTIIANQITTGTLTGITINSSTFSTTGAYSTAKLENGIITLTGINNNQALLSDGYLRFFNGSTMTISIEYYNGNISCGSLLVGGYAPITTHTINLQSVASANVATYAASSGSAGSASQLTNGSNYTYVSSNDNLIPSNSVMCVGSSINRWNSIYANNVYNSAGLITSSDERLKNAFTLIDDRYIRLLDSVTPYIFKYNDSSSDRFHMGMKAQEVEALLLNVGLTSKDFAALVKDPVYKDIKEDGEFDTSSEIIDHQYYLRYEEFIPLLIEKSHRIDNEIALLKETVQKQLVIIDSQADKINEIEHRLSKLEAA
jgi:phage minor structural protein